MTAPDSLAAVPAPKRKRTLRERIAHLADEANELESRAAALADRATAKRRLAERLQDEVDDAAGERA